METPPFARIYIDRSNSLGFQFEFYCQRCGNGYQSPFEPLSSLAADAGGYAVGKAAGFIPFVGDFIGDKASDVVKDKAKEGAFQRAVATMAPHFALCPRCHQWRCRSVCWNAQANMCIDCAPLVYPTAPSAPYIGQIYPAPQPSQGYPASAPSYSQTYPAAQPYAPYPPGQAAPYSVAPQYGYAAAPVATMTAPAGPPRTSGMAASSMILGLVGLLAAMTSLLLTGVRSVYALPCSVAFVTGLLAIILGHVALSQVNHSKGLLRGGGKAVTGFICGYLALPFIILSPFANLAAHPFLSFDPGAFPTSTPPVISTIPVNDPAGGQPGSGAPTQPAGQTTGGTMYYAGVWRSSNAGAAFWGNLTASDLDAKFQSYHAQNKRLVSLNVTNVNGENRFAAVWQSGTDAEAYAVNLSADELSSKFDTYHAEGLRLVSLAAVTTGGQTYFAAAWRSGSDAERYWVNITQDQVLSYFNTYHAQGYHLEDLVPYSANGQELFAASWRGGNVAEYYYTNMTADSLKSQFQTEHNNGLRLETLAALDDNGTVYFTGVWRAGSDAETYWANIDGNTLQSKTQALHSQGMNLVSLDLYS